MITVAAILSQLPGLDAQTLEIWITQDWVRPRREAGQPMFEAVDVARLRLILELRDQLEVNEPAIPVVLSLLDQLHATRNQLRRLAQAMEQAGPDAPLRSVLPPNR